MKAKVEVTLKKEVLDPQGQAVEHALHSLGFNEITAVRVGKLIELDLGNLSPSEAEKALKTMCDQLLANQVIEDYRWSILT